MIDRVAQIAREALLDHPDQDRIDAGEILLETTSKATIIYFLSRATRRPVLVAKASHGKPFDDGIRSEAEMMHELYRRTGRALGIPEMYRIDEVEGRTVMFMAPAPGKNMVVQIRPFSFRPVSILRRHFGLALAWLLTFRKRLASGPNGRVPVHGDFGPRNIHVGPSGEVAVVDWEYFQDAGGAFHDPCHFALLYVWLHYRSRHRLGHWEAWIRGLTGGGDVPRIVREFLSQAVPDCRGDEDIAEALYSYGEEVFSGRDYLALDPVIQAEPNRWEALIRGVRRRSR